MDFIHRYVPDWAIRIIIGLVAWFVICLFFIAPFVYDRVTIPLRKDFIVQVKQLNDHWENETDVYKSEEYANCLYAVYYKAFEIEFTQWIASATFYKPYAVRNMNKIINKPEYKVMCGETPWKNNTVEKNN